MAVPWSVWEMWSMIGLEAIATRERLRESSTLLEPRCSEGCIDGSRPSPRITSHEACLASGGSAAQTEVGNNTIQPWSVGFGIGEDASLPPFTP